MVYDNPVLLADLVTLSLGDEHPFAMRAARIVSICCQGYPELLTPFRRKIIRQISRVKNEGALRCILKIYAEVPMTFTTTEESVLTNLCFDYLTSQNAAIAIKVFSMEILYRLTSKIPEIGLELYYIIENQMPFASAGYKSKGQKIMKALARM